jgi:hypothetical protein
MPAKALKVGDKIRVSMHGGKIVDSVIKAILDTTDGLKYQVEFGNDGVRKAGCQELEILANAQCRRPNTRV